MIVRNLNCTNRCIMRSFSTKNNKKILTDLTRKRLHLIEKYKDKMLDGRPTAQKIQENLKQTIININEINQAKYKECPVLGYIIVGNKAESELYVRLKVAACENVGIEHKGVYLPHDTTEQEVINNVLRLSSDPEISGILVQLPMPKHINPENVLQNIPPEKDVDGLHPYNMGCLAMKNNSPYFISCTPLACQQQIL